MPTEDFLSSLLDEELTKSIQVIDKLEVTQTAKQQLLGLLILDKLGQTKRVFAYGEPFAAAEPACAPEFQRSFEHVDWVDGESVVQAEQTPGELGFNQRFHRIEDDLDGLGKDVAKAFACLASLRQEVAARLEDLSRALNLVHGDIHQCCHASAQPASGGTAQVLPAQGWGALNPALIAAAAGWQTGAPAGPAPAPIFLMPGQLAYAGGQPWMWMTGPGAGPPTTSDPAPVDPTKLAPGARAAVGGFEATYVGVEAMAGRWMHVFASDFGLLLKAVEGEAPTGEVRYRDAALEDVAAVARWAASNERLVARAFPDGGVTAEGLLARFGDADVGGGRTLAEAMAGVPAATRFEDAGAIGAEVAAIKGQALRASGRRSAALVGALGMEAAGARAGALPLGRFAWMPDEARQVLTKAGLGTIAALASAPTKQLLATLKAAGVTAAADEVEAWKAVAGAIGQGQ